MVSQFVSPDKVRLLGDLEFDFPEGTHALGRLDNESEGLLILTTNKKMTNLLFKTSKKHGRAYLVMVKNVVKPKTLDQLRNGIPFVITGGEEYVSSPCKVEIVENPRTIYPHSEDSREQFPHTWLLITLTEGKFHQVRKMVGNVQHRCFRLIRVSIENLKINHLAPGRVEEMDEKTIFELIGI